MAQDEQKKEMTSKGKTKEKESKCKEKPPTKVVIRRLPPTMTEEVFLEQIDPLPENDYFYYVKGEILIGVPTFSRAYINFKKQEDIFMFQDKFDGYIFLDQRGTEFPAVVEFAPYQKILKQESQGKEDKCNTIGNDPHYLEFLKKLENPEQFTLPSAEVYLEQIEQRERDLKSGNNKVNTPLVEFIMNRRQEKEKYREEKKEERRRKEIEKKKQRELERLKRKENKGKEGKGSSKGEEKTTFMVLKNTERSDSVLNEKVVKEEKKPSEKANEGSAQSSKKMREDKPPRSKDAKAKDRPPKEKKETQRKGEKKYEAIDKKTETTKLRESDKKNETVEEPPASQEKKTEEKRVDISEEKKKSAADDERSEKSEERSDRAETEREKKERIRNKDRPAMQIYRPGAKRSTGSNPADAVTAESSSPGSKRDVKTRMFTRSAPKE